MFSPYEFFRLASSLASQSPNEAASRTIVGRAYYACFLTARESMFGANGARLSKQLQKRIRRKKERGVHEVVRLAIGAHAGVRAGRAKRLMDQLGLLKDMRVVADYRLEQIPNTLFTKHGVSDWASLANQALTIASNIQSELNALPTFRFR